MLSRNVFAEIAADASKEHSFVSLNESYRSLGELVDISKQFYNRRRPAATYGILTTTSDPVGSTLKSKRICRIRSKPIGTPVCVCADSRAQIYINITSKHSQQSGTTTKSNAAEAKAIAWTIKDMLDFVPSMTKSRGIRPSDLGVVYALHGAGT
jgi:hypothetical protein